MEQISPIVVNALCAVLLGLLLAAASWTDTRTRRISNKLVLVGTLTGFTLNSVLPEGAGLFSTAPGGLGFLSALSGFAVGLGTLLPLYLLRAMGAGDVKLMAMVGAFLGPASILGAVLMTFVTGGILAITVALWKGVLLNSLANVRSMMVITMIKTMSGQGAQMEALPVSATGKLPYALAIATGTVAQILLAHSGHAIFS